MLRAVRLLPRRAYSHNVLYNTSIHYAPKWIGHGIEDGLPAFSYDPIYVHAFAHLPWCFTLCKKLMETSRCGYSYLYRAESKIRTETSRTLKEQIKAGIFKTFPVVIKLSF